jgi:hypothetical protein
MEFSWSIAYMGGQMYITVDREMKTKIPGCHHRIHVTSLNEKVKANICYTIPVTARPCPSPKK